MGGLFIMITVCIIAACIAWIACPWEGPRKRRTLHPTLGDALEAIDRKAKFLWRGNS